MYTLHPQLLKKSSHINYLLLLGSHQSLYSNCQFNQRVNNYELIITIE